MSWIEKYAPKNRSELIIPRNPVVVREIDKLFNTGTLTYRGLLLYDTACSGGTAKSTLINLFVKITGAHSIKIPTSGQTKKDLDEFQEAILSARQTAKFFSSSCSPIMAGKVVVIGNEIYKSSTDFVDGLRELIDDNKEEVLWLFSDNHFDTLVSKSPQMFNNQRILTLNWDRISEEDVLKRCEDILQWEGKNTAYNRGILDTAIKTHGPSIRAVLSELELYHV